MNFVHESKAQGRLVGVDMRDLGNFAASVTRMRGMNSSQHDLVSCGAPDASDPELAESEVSDIARYLDCDEEHARCIKACHAARAEEATGRGSWPAGCWPELFPDHHATKYFVNHDQFPSWYGQTVDEDALGDLASLGVWGTRDKVYDLYERKSNMEVILMLLDETYRRVGNVHMETTDRSEAQIEIICRRIPGSTIGIGWFPSGRCGDRVEFHIDSGYTPGLHPVMELWAHECGHTNRLEHKFRNQSRHNSIMSYDRRHPYVGFSTGEDPYDRPRDPSWSPLSRYYGGEPVPVEPELPPTEGPPELGGILEARQLPDGSFAWDGLVGPVPAEAVGARYHMRKISRNRYKLTPRVDL